MRSGDLLTVAWFHVRKSRFSENNDTACFIPGLLRSDFHLGQFVLHGLQFGDGGAKGLTFGGVVNGAIDGGLGDAQSLTRHSDATRVWGEIDGWIDS